MATVAVHVTCHQIRVVLTPVNIVDLAYLTDITTPAPVWLLGEEDYVIHSSVHCILVHQVSIYRPVLLRHVPTQRVWKSPLQLVVIISVTVHLFSTITMDGGFPQCSAHHVARILVLTTGTAQLITDHRSVPVLLDTVEHTARLDHAHQVRV